MINGNYIGNMLINPFFLGGNEIVAVENPVALSTPTGVAFGSLVFQPTVRCLMANGFHREVPVSYSAGSYDSATTGSYTLTGTLAPTGVVTNPSGLTAQIVVWVLPAASIWIDFIDKAKVTGTIDNFDRIVTQTSGKTGMSAVEYNTVLQRRPAWNGEGVYFNSNNALKQSGTVATLNAYHDGTQFTQYYIWKQLTVPNTHIGPIVDSLNISSANKGFGLYIDNRIAQSRTNRLYFIIGKGVSGQAPINLVSSSDNVVVQEAWNCAKITYDGTTVRMYHSANGSAFTQVGSATPAYSFGTGNATNLLSIGNLVTVGSQTGMKGYLKHMVLKNSLMSAGDQTLYDGWAQAMCQEDINVEDANIYLMLGQSNLAGRGVNANIAAELNGAVGARIMTIKPTPPTQTDASGTINSESYWEELELGVNQTIESVATQHGMEMRFGKEMWDYNENCWIVKLGVGGTPIYSTVTYNDWNVSSAQLYSQFYGLTTVALDEALHIFRKTPVVRGMIIMQGETDAIIAGADTVYKSNWTTFINTFIDAIATYGYSITKMRIFFWQISGAGGYAYDSTRLANIQAAQADLGTNYLTDNPSRTANIKGVTYRTTDDITFLDAQHYDEDGLDTMGNLLYEHFRSYTNES